jgi:hypothetical protein
VTDITPLDATPLAIFQHATVESVRKLEALNLTLPQVDLGTTHVIHAGMCARTIFIPKDTVLTGALTNLDNLCVLVGDITVTTDEGPKRLTGFHVLPANAGAKRAGIAHADTWWTTIWPTSLTNVDEIENEMTDESDQLQTRGALSFDGRKELTHGTRD